MFVLIPDLNWVPVEMGSLSYYHSATGDHTLYCYDMSANNIAGFCIVVARRMMWGCQLFALNKILHVWPFYWRLFGGIGFLLLILLYTNLQKIMMSVFMEVFDLGRLKLNISFEDFPSMGIFLYSMDIL